MTLLIVQNHVLVGGFVNKSHEKTQSVAPIIVGDNIKSVKSSYFQFCSGSHIIHFFLIMDISAGVIPQISFCKERKYIYLYFHAFYHHNIMCLQGKLSLVKPEGSCGMETLFTTLVNNTLDTFVRSA